MKRYFSLFPFFAFSLFLFKIERNQGFSFPLFLFSSPPSSFSKMGESLTFSFLFSHSFSPYQEMKKEVERAEKTGIASFLFSLHFLQSPLIFFLLFSSFSSSEMEEKMEIGRKDSFPFLILVRKRNRKQRILLILSHLLFWKRRKKTDQENFFIPYYLSFQGIGGGRTARKILGLSPIEIKNTKRRKRIFFFLFSPFPS